MPILCEAYFFTRCRMVAMSIWYFNHSKIDPLYFGSFNCDFFPFVYPFVNTLEPNKGDCVLIMSIQLKMLKGSFKHLTFG
jgi:hypothetical protein